MIAILDASSCFSDMLKKTFNKKKFKFDFKNKNWKNFDQLELEYRQFLLLTNKQSNRIFLNFLYVCISSKISKYIC